MNPTGRTKSGPFSEGAGSEAGKALFTVGVFVIAGISIFIASKLNGRAMDMKLLLGESVIRLHKASTHFPIGLLLASALFDGVGLVTRRIDLRAAGFWTLFLGALGSVATTLLGLLGNPFAGDSGEIAARVVVHQRIGVTSAVLFGLLTLWRIGRQSRFSRAESIAYIVVTLLGVALISTTGYLGSRLLD